MCYFLYGAINEGIDTDAYNQAAKSSNFHFNIGNAEKVNHCVKNCDDDYRITVEYCDCNTAIGDKHTNRKQLKDLQELLFRLKDIRGIKHIFISKNWANETNETEETVHINDIDVLYFLANIQDNCLYKIELYKKYY